MKYFYNFTEEKDPKIVSVEQCVFNDIHSDSNGGCIYESRSVTFSISRTLFSDCSSSLIGGSFYLDNPKTNAIIQKNCFHNLTAKSVGCIYYAKCNSLNSFLNIFLKNGNVNIPQLAFLDFSDLNERQVNYTYNTAKYCPVLYVQFGTTANVKDLSEEHCFCAQGALFDTNHIHGNVMYERINCVRNEIEKDSLGIFYFFNNTKVELRNAYAFNNKGCKIFAAYETNIYSYNCYTDFQNPSIGFATSSYKFNQFETHEYCFLTTSGKNNVKCKSIVNMFFASIIASV